MIATAHEPTTVRPGRWLSWLRQRSWLRLLYLQATFILYVAVCLVTNHPNSAAITFELVNLLSVIAICVGVWVHRPCSRSAWLLLAGSQLAYIVSTALFARLHTDGDQSFPSAADALMVPVYLTLIGAFAVFIHRRTPDWHAPTLIDAAVLATSAALLCWVYLLGPMTAHTGITVSVKMVALIYPVLDLLVLAMGVRLALGGGARTLAYHLILGYLGIGLVTDFIYMLQRLDGTYTDSSLVPVGYLIGSTLVGMAALHPSMTQVAEHSDVPAPDAGRRRLVLLAGAALIAPGVLAAQAIRGGDGDELAIAGACAVLFLLVVVRMAGLVAVQHNMAIVDPLTGVYARRFLDSGLKLYTRQARRNRQLLGILIVDVDHFKQVNDTYGHPIGDQVLRELAGRLQGSCRAGDAVARYGGEEFVVLVPSSSSEQLAALAERLRSKVASAPILMGEQLQMSVTVSIGAAMYPREGDSAEEVLHAADEALYEAKRGGRNRVVTAARPS
jgi:two-component system cell cycle response regulator